MKIYIIKYPKNVSFGKEKSPEKKQFTKLYLKQILKDEFQLNISDDDFGKNENGKPFLKKSNLYFNLSHSNEYLIIAFGKIALGIDIEKRKNINSEMLSKRFFHPKEYQFVQAQKDTEEAFFRIWTLKESYIKWKGGSLPADLQKFRIEITKNSLRAYETDRKVDKIFIKEYKKEDYFIAVCSEEDDFPNELIEIVSKSHKK